MPWAVVTFTVGTPPVGSSDVFCRQRRFWDIAADGHGALGPDSSNLAFVHIPTTLPP